MHTDSHSVRSGIIIIIPLPRSPFRPSLSRSPFRPPPLGRWLCPPLSFLSHESSPGFVALTDDRKKFNHIFMIFVIDSLRLE